MDAAQAGLMGRDRQAPETDVQLQRPVPCPSLGGTPARTLGHTSQNVNLAQKRMSVIAELGGGGLRSSVRGWPRTLRTASEEQQKGQEIAGS